MARCSFVTVELARFSDLKSMEGIDTSATAGHPRMWAVGADEPDANVEFGAQKAFTWIGFGLHDDERSAVELFDAGDGAAPCFAGADERWSGVLQPFNHRGEVNWLDPDEPGPVLSSGPIPADGEPFAVITSVGWTLDDRFDADKATDFGRGVLEVRASMDSVDGLLSHQSFGFPGNLDVDGATVTFWRDDAAMRAFAYRPGIHKTEMDRYRERDTADRTSFTRLRVLRSRGSVNGTNPVVT